MPGWLLIVIVVLVALWLLGLLTSFLGALIHILLAIALILFIVWLVQRISFK